MTFHLILPLPMLVAMAVSHSPWVAMVLPPEVDLSSVARRDPLGPDPCGHLDLSEESCVDPYWVDQEDDSDQSRQAGGVAQDAKQ